MFGSSAESSAFYGNRNPTNGDVVSTNLITCNVMVAEKVAAMRMKNATLRIPGYDVMGPAIGRGKDPAAALHIKPWRPLITYRDMSWRDVVETRRNGVLHPMLKLPVFGSFNGVTVKEGTTQDQFQDKYTMFGFSCTFYSFEEQSQSDTELSAVVSGSFTTLNTGIKRFLPGDLVMWRAPYVDREKREEFKQLRNRLGAVSEDNDAEMLNPILEPFSFDDEIRSVARRRITQCFHVLLNDFSSSESISLLNYALVNNQHALSNYVAPHHLLFGLKATGDITTSMMFLSGLIQSGIVTLNDPAIVNADIRQNGLKNAREFDRNTRTRFAKLAAHLGMLRTNGTSVVTEAQWGALVRDLLGRINYGFLDMMQPPNEWSIAKVFGDTARSDVLESTALARLIDQQRLASTHAFEMHCRAMNYAQQRVCGVALGFSDPNKNLDIVT
jgi:hypothetical protein